MAVDFLLFLLGTLQCLLLRISEEGGICSPLPVGAWAEQFRVVLAQLWTGNHGWRPAGRRGAMAAGRPPELAVLRELVAEAGISLMSRKVQFYRLRLQNVRLPEKTQSMLNCRKSAYSLLRSLFQTVRTRQSLSAFAACRAEGGQH